MFVPDRNLAETARKSLKRAFVSYTRVKQKQLLCEMFLFGSTEAAGNDGSKAVISPSHHPLRLAMFSYYKDNWGRIC